MVAVPLPVGVQRYYEQVRARERLENLRRPALLQDRVAERPRHPLENGGMCEETNIARGQVGEQLRPQVLGHEPIAPRERRRARGPEPPRPDRQRSQVQACGPALCVLGELGDLLVRQVQSARRSAVGAPRLRPCGDRPARSPPPGPAHAPLPAGTPAGLAPTAPSVTLPRRVVSALRSRRGRPGCRADADRRAPKRGPHPSSPGPLRGAGRPSRQPTRLLTPVRRTRCDRAARRGGAPRRYR